MKRYMQFILLSLGMLALVLAGCASTPATPAPPKIHYGEDICTECGMIINDPRFACAYAHETGEGRYENFIFDDVGDMLHHMQENLTLKAVGWWVHDYGSEEWIDATTAYYVVSDQIKSPMNHGIAAFAAERDAATLATDLGAAVLDWDKLRIEHALAGHHH